MTENPIVAVEIQETQYGEKVAIQSPFDAKDFIKAMPFNEFGTYDDYEKELRRNDITGAAAQAALDFEFSDTFATHRSWETNAFGKEQGGWLIDTGAWTEAKEFFEFAGFETENKTEL